MKRTLPFLLILALIAVQLPAFLAVPVKAADTDTGLNLINVLDFCYPNGGTDFNQTITAGTYEVTFTMPYKIDWMYVDILYSYVGAVPSSVKAYTVNPSNSVELEIFAWGGYIRLFGSSIPGASASITLQFTQSATSWVAFESFDMSTSPMTKYWVKGGMDVTYGSSGSQSKTFDTRNVPPGDFVLYNESAYDDAEWFWYITPDEWEYYDFLDFNLYFNSCTVSSISVIYGKSTVPYYSNNFDLTNPSNRSTGLVDLRIDLRNLDRTQYDDEELFILISGQFQPSVSFTLSILDGSYFYISDSIDPLYFWLRNIDNSLFVAAATIVSGVDASIRRLELAIEVASSRVNNQISVSAGDIIDALNSLMGSTGAGEQVKQEAVQQAGKVDQAVSGLGDFNKPASGSGGLSGDISEVIKPDVISGSTMVLSSVLNAPYVSIVATIALTLSLAAYVLFGKRGG